ncbi:hypothetical protein EDD22DRAFT_892969 [Suillus occidentalis]|nr:hypothetical protein EDD22DRAFT_892969 [Suillus occidentalis]
MAPTLVGESFVKASYYNMLEVLRCIFKDNNSTNGDDPKLVIAIDEAYPLNKMSFKGFRPSHIVGRTISCYSHNSCASVWVVFASKTPQAVEFLVPLVIHNSLRVAAAGPFDIPALHLADPLSAISANDVAKFSHIVGFGRPLWKSLAEKCGASDIVNWLPRNYSVLTFALVTQMLSLISKRRWPVTRVYASQRLMIGCGTFTGYPSEPLLSCVAAILLHRAPNSLVNALMVLDSKVEDGMVKIGQRGELASRLLLLLAKDLFVRKNPSSGETMEIDAELIDCQKVSVIDFLEYLFGKTFWLNLADQAKAAFQHAYINFSHWVSMSEFISPPVPDQTDADPLSTRCSAEEWTLRHWHRTSAVQCCHLQPLVDKMIPIYFDDPALGSEDINRVSQMFISDTAGKNCNVQELGYNTRKHDAIQCLSDLPYIALILDFNKDPWLRVTFAESDPDHPETDQCLRIYASESRMSGTTFPFLDEYREIAGHLQQLVSRPTEAQLQRNLQGLVKFGSTARLQNSQWDAQDA